MALETHRNERCVFIKVCKSVKMKFEAIMYNKKYVTSFFGPIPQIKPYHLYNDMFEKMCVILIFSIDQ